MGSAVVLGVASGTGLGVGLSVFLDNGSPTTERSSAVGSGVVDPCGSGVGEG